MATGVPGNLRQLLNANGKKKPKKQRKRKVKVRRPTDAELADGRGGPMPPAAKQY